MRTKVPPGCVGFRTRDGRTIDKNADGSVTLEGRDEQLFKKSVHKGVGLVSTEETWTLGTKKGRYCKPCIRLWNVWNDVCPKCGKPTEDAE